MCNNGGFLELDISLDMTYVSTKWPKIGLFDCFLLFFSFRLLLCHSCRNGKSVSPLLESYMHVWCEWL